jgi:MerC mercury resistance protein.
MKSLSLDKLAILLSGVCMVHCLLAPVVLTLLPILSLSILVEELVFHQLMLWLVLPSSLVALFIGCRRHRNGAILMTGLLGISVLALVAIWGHHNLTASQEKLATTLGGLILALSHYLNYRACQAIRCNSENCSSDHHH